MSSKSWSLRWPEALMAFKVFLKHWYTCRKLHDSKSQSAVIFNSKSPPVALASHLVSCLRLQCRGAVKAVVYLFNFSKLSVCGVGIYVLSFFAVGLKRYTLSIEKKKPVVKGSKVECTYFKLLCIRKVMALYVRPEFLFSYRGYRSFSWVLPEKW